MSRFKKPAGVDTVIDTKSVPGKIVVNGIAMDAKRLAKQAGGTGVVGSWKAGKQPKVKARTKHRLINWR